jgi:hypothetical protein
MDKTFWRATLIRAIRTICQTAVASIGTAMVVTDVNWIYVLSASALAGILSVLTSIATGLPEVDAGELLGTGIQTLYSEYPDEFEPDDEESEVQ